jgi:hypothetical protein
LSRQPRLLAHSGSSGELRAQRLFDRGRRDKTL